MHANCDCAAAASGRPVIHWESGRSGAEGLAQRRDWPGIEEASDLLNRAFADFEDRAYRYDTPDRVGLPEGHHVVAIRQMALDLHRIDGRHYGTHVFHYMRRAQYGTGR